MENGQNLFQTPKSTYIEKYGCQEQYFALKECMRNAPPAKIKQTCDGHFTKIGLCILSASKKKWKIKITSFYHFYILS